MIVEYKNLTDEKLIIKNPEYKQMARGRNGYKFIKVHAGFDIETTNKLVGENKLAFMWIWQFSFNDLIIIGRHWNEFNELLRRICILNHLNSKTRMIIWIANMSFEFQFMRKWVNVTKIFARTTRKPLQAIVMNCFEFRDALAITGGSLETLANDYTKTKKLVGDLDYSIERNDEYPILEIPKELQYCINDVLILKEFSEYMWNNFIEPFAWLPLTKTGIIRKPIKDFVKSNKEISAFIYESFPNEKLYRFMMNWVYRGGYVHALASIVGQVIDCVSIDLTSSYPAQMFHHYNCMGELYDVPVTDAIKLMQTHCVIIHAVFKNIKPLTGHSLESKSKLMNYSKDCIFDNGRLVSGSFIEVGLTELDFKNYLELYDWDEMEILHAWAGKRGNLPDWLLNPLKHDYIAKATKKANGESYALEKGKVNSYYGMACTRIYSTLISYNNKKDEWFETEEGFDFEKERKKAFLLPQWGVWISAWARYEILQFLLKLDNGNDAYYMDTDSIKVGNFEKHKKIIEEYNKKQEELNRSIFNSEELTIFHDLGCFDLENSKEENPHIKLKTLGAKRYIYQTSSGKLCSTIAGLPKKALIEYCEKNKITIFDVFNDGMKLDLVDSDKRTTFYNDEETSAIIDEKIMTEKSSVCIYDIPFTLGMAPDFITYLSRIEYKRDGKI